MALVRMMRPESDNDLNAIIGRLERLESGASGNPDLGNETAVTPGVQNISDQRSQAVQNIVDMEMEARLEKHLETRLSEMLENMQVSDIKPKNEPVDQGAQSDIIKDMYSPAVAEDIIEISKKWNGLVLPKLEGLYKTYGAEIDVEPSPDYSQDGPARLRIVFDDRDTTNVRYLFFLKEENRSKLADMVSEIIKKQVEIDIVTRKGTRGVVDKQSLALNKINFDNIKIKESEED